MNILSFSLTLYVLHPPQSLCFWQEKFISNSASALCWDVLRPWLQPQSHPHTPTETNHRSCLPSSHGNPVLTTRHLNLRFNMVELSLAIQSGEPLLSHHCIPQPLLFFSLLFLSALSCTHHITSFLVHLSSPVMFLLQISTSLNPIFSFVLSSYLSLLIITTKTCSASHTNRLQTHIFALLCLCFMRHNLPLLTGSVMLSLTPRHCQLEDCNAKLWGALSTGQIAISVPNTIKDDWKKARLAKKDLSCTMNLDANPWHIVMAMPF